MFAISRTRWHTRPLSRRAKRRSSAAPVRCERNIPASSIPQTRYALLITLPHLGITGSWYKVQNREEYSFIKKFNLPWKVDKASDILHKAATGVENWDGAPGVATEFPIAGNKSGDPHRNRTRRLVIEWVNELQEMIDQAPPGNTAGDAGME